LKKQQFGTFTLALKDDIDLNQLLFEHKVHHFKFKGDEFFVDLSDLKKAINFLESNG
jgi:hypothetical protein